MTAGNNSGGGKAPSLASSPGSGPSAALGARAAGTISDVAGALRGAPVGQAPAGVAHTAQNDAPSAAHLRNPFSAMIEEWRRQVADGVETAAKAPTAPASFEHG
jgi:hypothetical protein